MRTCPSTREKGVFFYFFPMGRPTLFWRGNHDANGLTVHPVKTIDLRVFSCNAKSRHCDSRGMGDGGVFRKLIEWSWNFVKVVASRSCICLNLRAAISPAAKMRGGFPEQFELNEQRDCGEEMQKGISLQQCTFTLIRSEATAVQSRRVVRFRQCSAFRFLLQMVSWEGCVGDAL